MISCFVFKVVLYHPLMSQKKLLPPLASLPSAVKTAVPKQVSLRYFEILSGPYLETMLLNLYRRHISKLFGGNLFIGQTKGGRTKMSQRQYELAKAPCGHQPAHWPTKAHQPYNLSSIPGSHMRQGENSTYKSFSDLHVPAVACFPHHT